MTTRRGVCWEHQNVNMAAYRGKEQKDISSSDVDLLLHPELLSQDFLKLILKEVSNKRRLCKNCAYFWLIFNKTGIANYLVKCSVSNDYTFDGGLTALFWCLF